MAPRVVARELQKAGSLAFSITLLASIACLSSMFIIVLTAIWLFASALAAPRAAVRVIHERRSLPALDRRARVDPDSIVPVRIGLTQSNLDSGYERLMDVSHPLSKNYGQHLSAAEVHELFAPTNETTSAVKEWLIFAGVDAGSILHYANKGWLSVDMPAWQAEELLSTEYYEHDSKDGIRIGCDEYSLPAHISKHVDYIKPGVKLSPPLKKHVMKRDLWPHRGRPSPPHGHPNWFPNWHMPPGAHGLPPDLQNCGVNITPVCIQALYHIPRATSTDPANVMGLYETYDAFSQQVRLW